MNRLKFIRQETLEEEVYSVLNQKDEYLCNIERRRTGQFMHWCQVIPNHLIESLAENMGDIQFSPGCLDEIREFCRSLNGRKKNE